jgi:hypothetical protein
VQQLKEDIKIPDKMVQVSSSNIAEIGYSAETNEFVVKFLNHKIYVYDRVPEEVAKGAFTAPSVGSWVNKYLVKKYGYREINLSVNMCETCLLCIADCEGFYVMNTQLGEDNVPYCASHQTINYAPERTNNE